MKKKLIFLDIDGTLTVAGSNEPPQSALQAIDEAKANGHKVFLCTGRNLDMLSPLLRYGFDGMVASSGGYVCVGNKVIADYPMPDEDRDTALRTLHESGVFCTIEAKNGSWGDANLKGFLDSQPEGNSEIERWRAALAGNLGIRPMEAYDGSPIYKVVVMCLKSSQLQSARNALEDRYNFVMQEVPAHGCINGEIVSRRFDKGRGVQAVCRYLGVSTEDTIGFGDSMNDLEMIRAVGTSVCMGNGAQSLKKISDVVAPPVTEDGLYKAFKSLGLFEQS
jgi:Cof subfamily protein (haloacid dehalogenase superfamily)